MKHAKYEKHEEKNIRKEEKSMQKYEQIWHMYAKKKMQKHQESTRKMTCKYLERFFKVLGMNGKILGTYRISTWKVLGKCWQSTCEEPEKYSESTVKVS